MSIQARSDAENDLIVADYFAMLEGDVAGRSYNKAAHRRKLLPRLNGRTEGSVEFKHQNISAVLKGLGEVWITGHKPAFNFQASLIDAVARWLKTNPDWTHRTLSSQTTDRLAETAPDELEQMLHIARKFDVAAQQDRNRALGKAGEERVLKHERDGLIAAGRKDLAQQVRWVAVEDGDGAGYDIASFDAAGRQRLIEVKTTNGWERTPFHISRNELAVAKERREEWCLFRLWDFARTPKAFELRPPLDAHLSLTATSFEASFH